MARLRPPRTTAAVAARAIRVGAAALRAAGTAAVASAFSLTAAAAAPGPFDRTLTLQGIEFHVRSANDASLGRLEITPKGLAIDNSIIVREIDGTVTDAAVADLNGDGSPELYVFVTSAGSGSYGSLVAFAANRRKSLSEITLPAMDAHPPAAAAGYQGHDRFSVGRRHLVRQFPVYAPTDPQSAPSLGTRELRYRLAPGEASWQLKLDSTRKR